LASYTTVVGMAFSDWKAESFSSAWVDSALAGNQDRAWLSSTPVSLPANEPRPRTAMIQNASTIHLVFGPVNVPAI
jgi:hypothetical protein